MAQILQQNVLGKPVADPVFLDRRRRRLATVVKRYANQRRPFIVNVRKAHDPAVLEDENDKLRGDWVHTLVGPDDVVAIVYLPLGQGGTTNTGGAASGGRSSGKQIGQAVSMVALAVAAAVLFAPTGGLSLVAAMGLPAGATAAVSALASTAVIAGGGYLIQRSFSSKANKPGAQDPADRPLYGVTGGGNLPRPGDRIPRGYGRFWTRPDLSQPDYFTYEGEDQILFKRMTLGLGHYDVKQIQVGSSVLWTKADGIHLPFVGAQIEIIPPNGASSLVPQSVFSTPDVGGNELPRPSDIFPFAGPFAGTPVGVTASEYQIDFTLPEGCYAELDTPSEGGKRTTSQWAINVEYAPCDDDNNPTGGWANILTEVSPLLNSTRALRYSRVISTGSNSRFLFRVQNGLDETLNNHNRIVLDGVRAYVGYNQIRPHVTEVAVKIVSGPSLGITAFSEILVEASAIIPTNTGGAWVLNETDKAAWAYADILRGFVNGVSYGAELPDSSLDLGLIRHYASQVGPYDVFNGIIRGPVSVFEASQTVLGAMRAEPFRLGNAWSIIRDESKNVRKHVFSRRQIMRGSSTANFRTGGGDGASDVIAEYFYGGDPRRRREVRTTFGSSTVTPRRIRLEGVTSHEHAAHISIWMAASNYYRRQTRRFTAELAGRLVKRNDPVFVDVWFLTDAKVFGVVDHAGTTITLDSDVFPVSGDRAVFRDRQGLDFGPINFTMGSGNRTIILDSDDVSALESAYDMFLEDIWATDVEDMTSVSIGNTVETREPYIIQSAQPRGRDQIAVEALHDHPSVWEALGEVAIDPGASAVGDKGDDPPEIAYIFAHTVQYSSQTLVEWVLGRVRNAALLVVDLSYDNWATFERVSEGLATSGQWPLRSDGLTDTNTGTAWIRAYAVNAYGVQGRAVNQSFTIWRPFISSEWANLIVRIQDLQEGVRRDIEQISKIGENTLRDAVRDLDKKVNALAAHAATEAGRTYETDNVVKVALDGHVQQTFAAIQEEVELRISATEALAKTAQTLAVRLGGAEAAILTEHTARITADGAEATSRETLSAEHAVTRGLVGTANDDIAATRAMVVHESQVRADEDSALAQDVTVVSTTVDGHTLTISEVTQSLNGDEGFWGVAVTADGTAVGGIRLEGIRNLDGSYYSEFGIMGDLVVTGTISGSKLQTENIISVSAQIGNLIVDNLHVKNQAITQTLVAVGSFGSATVSVTSRGTGNWVVWCYYYGEAGNYVPLGTTPGGLSFLIDGTQNDGISLNYEASGANNSSGFSRLQTLLITAVSLGAGTHSLSVSCSIGGAVRIVATEASK